MNLIKPYTEIIAMTPDPLKVIELGGRTCYKSEDKITDDSAKEFVKMILKRGHESVLEHASMTVRFVCDRGVSHEIVRHRLASYSQESTRYCDYNNGHITFIIPPWVNSPEGIYDTPSDVLPSIDEHGPDKEWLYSIFLASESYKDLRTMGWKPEQARSVLPNSLKTEVVMTANFREWRHFFKLRTAPAAHPQMREVTLPLLERVRGLAPVIFDDI